MVKDAALILRDPQLDVHGRVPVDELAFVVDLVARHHRALLEVLLRAEQEVDTGLPQSSGEDHVVHVAVRVHVRQRSGQR